MTELPFEIRPVGDDALRRAFADAGRGPGQARPVSARLGGLIFQFSDHTLLGSGEELLGPYCSSCKKALLQVTYTEWTTADPIEAELEASCPSCGHATGTRKSVPKLRRLALEALRERMQAAGLSRGEQDAR